jgi:hypothetical protein
VTAPLAAKLITELFVAVLLGVKVASRPVGSPVAVNVTLPLKLPVRLMLMVELPLPPWPTDMMPPPVVPSEKPGVFELVIVNGRAIVWSG